MTLEDEMSALLSLIAEHELVMFVGVVAIAHREIVAVLDWDAPAKAALGALVHAGAIRWFDTGPDGSIWWSVP
jgi:uncharacterized heparinase superfamily protein